MPPTLGKFAEHAGAKAQSVVFLVEENKVVAAFAVADVIRPESKQAVQRLHGMGVEVAMLTGDSRPVAEAVASELGIDHVFAEVLPEHKDQKVAELQSPGKASRDGRRRCERCARAYPGRCGHCHRRRHGRGHRIGGADPGAGATRWTWSRSSTLSRASYRKMIQNLWWAAGYNIVALPLAAGILAPWGILLSPAIGALLMSLSTIIVAINAQLLRQVRLAAQ